MPHFVVNILLALLGCITLRVNGELSPEEFIKKANEQIQHQLWVLIDAQWNQGANISKYNEEKLIEVSKAFDVFRKRQFKEISAYDIEKIEPISLRRQFEKFAVLGTSVLESADSLKEMQLSMEKVFSTSTIEANGKKGLSLEPDLTRILDKSTNETLLKEVWLNWRDATGPKMRENFKTYYKLGNKAAKLNKLSGKEFKDFADLWMFSWETPDLKLQVDELMRQTLPLYEKIHAYVRYHLTQRYPTVMPTDGTIPAHLLGNMWAQQWSNILNTIPSLNPHKDVHPIDSEVNQKLKKWSVIQMVQLSEKFFHDIGMQNMTNTFYTKSILEKPTDRNLTCHASAWDFYDGHDFRIKQCTEKTINDLITVHHEMGHIQYYMNYAKQPPVYREGANPGFHEAIGDLIALSVSTPEHLSKVGLLAKESDQSKLSKINLNYQLKMALDKIVFLPFAYVMDKWRWDIFGDAKMEDHLNRHWWELRLKYQGISPPVKRSEKDFDPGAKYHIAANVEYVRYFVSHILQFQFFEHMCSFVRNVSDLYKCDFDGNKQAGTSLMRMLEKGSSDTWQNILRDFIGSDRMSLSSLNKYFAPLERFLDGFIASHNITVGWNAKVDDYMVSWASSGAVNFALLVLCLAATFLFRM